MLSHPTGGCVRQTALVSCELADMVSGRRPPCTRTATVSPALLMTASIAARESCSTGNLLSSSQPSINAAACKGYDVMLGLTLRRYSPRSSLGARAITALRVVSALCFL